MNLQKQVQPTGNYVFVVIKWYIWHCGMWLKLLWEEGNYILSDFPWKGLETPLNECPRSLTRIVSSEIYDSYHTPSNALAVNRITVRKKRFPFSLWLNRYGNNIRVKHFIYALKVRPSVSNSTSKDPCSWRHVVSQVPCLNKIHQSLGKLLLQSEFSGVTLRKIMPASQKIRICIGLTCSQTGPITSLMMPSKFTLFRKGAWKL